MKSLRHVAWPLSPTYFLASTLIILFTISTNSNHQHTVSAQTSFIPASAAGQAFARTQTKLYILGGDVSNNGVATQTNQFMSLDLNVSWSVTAPAWKKLPDGPYQSIFPAAFSSDEQTMYVFHIDGTNSPYQYNVASGTWALTQITFQNMAWQGLNVVTDPRTGLMYIPGGYNNVNIKLSSPTLTIMEIFDPITLSINQTQLPVLDQVFPVRWYYQNVWSSKRNATLYFGGNYRQGETPLPLGLDNVITAFSPDTSTWFTLTTTGVSPAIRADHCMAANEDGSVVVIYGGRLRNNTVSGEVFTLDVERKWTSGISGPPRMYAACTVAGNQLIVWGGKSADNLLAPPDVMIYNFATNVWATQYTPPASYASLKPPPKITRTIPPWGTATSSGLGGTVTGTRIPSQNPTPNPNSPSPTPAPVSVGLIAGGVIGGLALVTAVIGIIFVRYRRNQRRGRGFFVKPTRDDLYESRSLATGAASLSTGWGSNRRRRDSLGKDPMESNEEYELERTLMDIEEQKRELEMRQQFLVLQHRAENPDPVSPSSPTSAGLTKVQKRGPSAYVEPEAEYIPIPSSQPEQKSMLSPRMPSTLGTGLSENWTSPSASAAATPTTTTGPIRVVSPTYATPITSSQQSSYISPSSIVRTSSSEGIQGGLVQDTPEPTYELDGGIDATYPDLVYGSAQMGGGKDWVRRAQGPQIVVAPGSDEGGSNTPRGPSALLPSLPL